MTPTPRTTDHANDMNQHLAALQPWMAPPLFTRLSNTIQNAIALKAELDRDRKEPPNELLAP